VGDVENFGGAAGGRGTIIVIGEDDSGRSLSTARCFDEVKIGRAGPAAERRGGCGVSRLHTHRAHNKRIAQYVREFNATHYLKPCPATLCRWLIAP